ncbi:MAG: hypothetical protein ACE14V_03970 [bacterium]
MPKHNHLQLQTDILKYLKPSLIFSIDLDATAGEDEAYELVWNKLELALTTALYHISKSDKPEIVNQRFSLWGQLGTTLNAEDHLCNAYFIYVIPETAGTGFEEALAKSCEEYRVFWTLEESRVLDEECVPLYKYTQEKIIRYVFDQISEDGQVDLGCSNIEFLTWDEDWHICSGAYAIDMCKEHLEQRLSNGKKVRVQYRRYTIEP